MMTDILIKCPTCGCGTKESGIVLNRLRSIGARLMEVGESIGKLQNRKPNPPLLTRVDLEAQRGKLEVERSELEKEQNILKGLIG